MSRLSTREFEMKLDEWAAGTLPDYERGRMEDKMAESADCRELADAAFAIIGAARAERLDLPGDAYFEDLALRIEEELETEMPAAGPTIVLKRRAPLFSSAQLCASFIAAVVVSLWTVNTVNAIPAQITLSLSQSEAIDSRVVASAAAPVKRRKFDYVAFQAENYRKMARVMKETRSI